MKEFLLTVPVTVLVRKKVMAENEDDAILSAVLSDFSLSYYMGNGGTDKIVGVSNRDLSIEALDPSYDEIEAEEL